MFEGVYYMLALRHGSMLSSCEVIFQACSGDVVDARDVLILPPKKWETKLKLGDLNWCC